MKYANSRWQNHVDKNIHFPSEGAFQTPILKPEKWEPVEFMPYQKTTRQKDYERGVHFFLDDFRFERVWHYLDSVTDSLSRFAAVMAPDFSLFTDYPKMLQMWNHWRKHYVGAYWQMKGMKVYPTICWSDESSYDWCFDGEPVGGTVCVSTLGTQTYKRSRDLFLEGYREMQRCLKPETIVIYGRVPEKCTGNIVNIESFDTKFRVMRDEA